MQEMLVGLPGVIGLADDILIWGKSKPEHNAALTVLQNRGAMLNLEKCLICVTEMIFFGLKISDKGIGISEEKLEALLKAPAPDTRRNSKLPGPGHFL